MRPHWQPKPPVTVKLTAKEAEMLLKAADYYQDAVQDRDGRKDADLARAMRKIVQPMLKARTAKAVRG